ncbi:MAG: UTP--glucose-1-phosphate uridylyltransferase [Pirellulaceae bacterium]
MTQSKADRMPLRRARSEWIIAAGGQGSRLGFDQPKGLFPIGPVSNRTLFQFHADLLKAVRDRYQVMIPMYVMTSPATHEETLRYFEQTNQLGLADGQLHVFCRMNDAGSRPVTPTRSSGVETRTGAQS